MSHKTFWFVCVPTFHDNAIGFCYSCIGACDSIDKACTKAWVTCVATCDATKFRGGDLGKMEQKCSRSRDNWLWSVTLTWNSGHHIYMSTRMNCKTHGFLANPENRTVETSSKTHGLLRALSPCLYRVYYMCIFHVASRGSKSNTTYDIQVSDRFTWWSNRKGVQYPNDQYPNSKLIPGQGFFPFDFDSKAMGVIMSFCGGKIYKRHCLWQCQGGVYLCFLFCVICVFCLCWPVYFDFDWRLWWLVFFFGDFAWIDFDYVLLMAEILQQLVSSLSSCLRAFYIIDSP